MIRAEFLCTPFQTAESAILLLLQLQFSVLSNVFRTTIFSISDHFSFKKGHVFIIKHSKAHTKTLLDDTAKTMLTEPYSHHSAT